MSKKALETYLNDHLAGATLGEDLSGRLRERTEGTPLHETLSWVAAEIEEDREKVKEVMDRLDAAENPVKQATAWLGEKASRLKLGELGSLLGAGDDDYGLFISLETLSIGVEGKLRFWLALRHVAADHDGLDPVELERFAERARRQRDALEKARIDLASSALRRD